jgi:hypothetical protein
LFDDDAITSSQSLLATFTKVKDTIYMDAIPAIVDMSTKLGGDLQGTTLQVGKALNDPIKGIAALSRAGVSFTESQKATIKSMVAMNDVAGAQKLILQELQTEFGGSALAASQVGTGPMVVLQHEFGNVREEIGGMVMALIIDLKPALQSMIEGLSSAVNWVKENKRLITDLAFGIGIFATAMVTVVPFIEGFTVATTAAAIAETEAAVATTALLGPVGLLVIAVAALAAVWYDVSQASERALQMQQDNAKRHASSTTSALEEDLKRKVKAGGNELALRKQLSESYIKLEQQDLKQSESDLQKATDRQKFLREQGFSSQADDMQKGIDKLKGQVSEYQSGISAAQSFGSVKPALTTAKSTAGAGAKATGATPPKTDKATGSKSVTINMQINDIIKEFTINTTNIKEGANRVKDMVADALLNSINSSLHTAGQ